MAEVSNSERGRSSFLTSILRFMKNLHQKISIPLISVHEPAIHEFIFTSLKTHSYFHFSGL